MEEQVNSYAISLNLSPMLSENIIKLENYENDFYLTILYHHKYNPFAKFKKLA